MITIEGGSVEIKYDDKFKRLMHRLLQSEYEQLEKSIKAEGCREPLVIWQGKNILLDGHHRLEICRKHNVAFKTEELEFENEYDAVEWIIKNQFGRRNLSAYRRIVLGLKLRQLIAMKAKDRQRGGLGGKELIQKSGEANDPICTDRKIAKIVGVSHDTVNKVSYILKHKDKASDVIAQLEGEEISINKAHSIVQKIMGEGKSKGKRKSADDSKIGDKSGDKPSPSPIDNKDNSGEQGNSDDKDNKPSPASSNDNENSGGDNNNPSPKPIDNDHSDYKRRAGTTPKPSDKNRKEDNEYLSVKEVIKERGKVELVLEWVIELLEAHDKQDQDGTKKAIEQIRLACLKK